MPSIQPLATLTPTCNARTWLSAPHPHFPIVATACSDKTVRIYSLQNFQQQSTISGGHKRSIRSCAWKPDSGAEWTGRKTVGGATEGRNESVLATGSFDASAGIWRRWEGGVQDRGREIDFTGGLAGGEEDGDAEEEDEWRFAVILDGHDSEIKSLAFSPSNPALLATCSRDKSVWIWESLDDEGGEDNFETVAVLQDHEGDVKCVCWHPTEELLASGSYDDTIRLWREDVDDWACCARLEGHKGTVWWVEFEAEKLVGIMSGTTPENGDADDGITNEEFELSTIRQKAGPRLMSCSDDGTIRVWRREPKDRPAQDTRGVGGAVGGKMPSIWKNRDFDEDWIHEASLPQVHERPVYAVSWSRRSGYVASTGSDGKIVVYEEVVKRQPSSGQQSNNDNEANGDTEMADGTSVEEPQTQTEANGNSKSAGVGTEWVVMAEIDNAHDVFEINHICWALRVDKGKRIEGEEVLVSTGDDGEVKVWTFDER